MKKWKETTVLVAQLELFAKENNPYSGKPMKGTKEEGKMYLNIFRNQDIRRGVIERESRECRNYINRKAQKARECLINGLKWTNLWNLSWKLLLLVLLILPFSQEFLIFHLVIAQ